MSVEEKVARLRSLAYENAMSDKQNVISVKRKRKRMPYLAKRAMIGVIKPLELITPTAS